MHSDDISENLARFLGNFYHLEVVADKAMAESSRMFVASDAYKAHAKGLKEAFGDLLRTRALSVEAYARITGVEFGTAGELYTYLQSIYDFLFTGASLPALPQTAGSD